MQRNASLCTTILNNKGKYGPCNRDDFDCDGITDIPVLFGQKKIITNQYL